MNRADHDHGPLQRYGTHDDDKTRPGVVLFDWSDDDDGATVRVSPLEHAASVALSAPPDEMDDVEELDDDEVMEIDDDEVEEIDDREGMDAIGMRLLRPRWPGVGRRPGAVALTVVLALSFAIGAFAMFGSGEAQAADASALLAP